MNLCNALQELEDIPYVPFHFKEYINRRSIALGSNFFPRPINLKLVSSANECILN